MTTVAPASTARWNSAFDICAVQVDGDRRATERGRRRRLAVVVLGKSSLSNTGDAVDRHAGMHQLAVRSGHPHFFGGIERLDVEVDGRGRVVDDEVWRRVWGCCRWPWGSPPWLDSQAYRRRRVRISSLHHRERRRQRRAAGQRHQNRRPVAQRHRGSCGQRRRRVEHLGRRPDLDPRARAMSRLCTASSKTRVGR